MTPEFDARFKTVALTALRIAAGAAYFVHGAQKALGWFGGMGPNHSAVDLMTRFGAAGIMETAFGALLIAGLLTRPVAFLASGEMAVTYFWMHWGGSGHMWWWENHGELPLLYTFIWLLFSAYGAGPVSLDGALARRKS
ncbi:MAG TPA: DoxX family protein [Gemmatimonadaceae bacterium]|nr:DoxX family protein [Gemmatimonadaceae bacterium]